MKRLQHLAWWDILILTLILFGQPIWLSTELYLTGEAAGTAVSTELTANQDYDMIMVQGVALLLALSYLWLRKFEFKQWAFAIDAKATRQAIGLFLVFAVLMEVLFLCLSPGYATYFMLARFDILSGFNDFLAQLRLSRLLYALLNGFYEEIYFMGMVLAVKPEKRTWFFAFSLLVRIAFHTYQGLLSAFGIGLILGIGYYIWYIKLGKKNLYPIVLSHAIADVWGLGLLLYLFGS